MHRLACFLAFSTLILIVAGSLVTSQDYGLAVPDWPKSYGMWFPPMIGGVFYEHGHRMIAGFVGILTVLMTAWLWWKESRKWVKMFGTIALLAVVLQAVLGGITVLYFLPTWVSTMHATLAQTFFCMTVSLAVFTSRWWKENTVPATHPSSPAKRWIFTTLLIYIQLILGSYMRHSEAALAIPDFPLAFGQLIPPFTSREIVIHFAHRIGALVILIVITMNLIVSFRSYRKYGALLRPAVLLFFLVLAQITIGAFTVWTKTGVVFASAHVIVGASILATSLVAVLCSYRLFHHRSGQVSAAWQPAVKPV